MNIIHEIVSNIPINPIRFSFQQIIDYLQHNHLSNKIKGF